MADIEGRRPCSFRQCHGEMLLKKHQPAGPPPARKRDADTKPHEAQWLRAWECTSDPRRHVEVVNWGVRPLKACTVKGCKGIMVHWGRVRALAPDNLRRRNGQTAFKIVYRSGYVCIEDAEHFDPDDRNPNGS
jgi:hypothetical protein